MKIDRNDSAFPSVTKREVPEGIEETHCRGLTAREHFAAMAMQGICSNPKCNHLDATATAKEAVKIASALIAELNKGDAK